MSPLLSIVIPLYNCAPVIVRCLDSIDYPNAEIIVVNDGSSDNGAEVVGQYAKTHANVFLLNKSNGGVSSARNAGIDKARGKYLAFVDADDYLSLGGLELMVDLAEDHHADVVKYKINPVNHDAPCVYNSVAGFPFKVDVIEGDAQALNRYDISDFHVVDAIFRTAVIRDNGVRFCSGIHLREDDVFMGSFYSVASKVVVTDLPLYNYYRVSDYSHTHRQSLERQRLLIESSLLAMRHRKEFISTHCPNQTFSYERLKYMRWVCQLRGAVEAGLTLKEYKALLEEYRKEEVYPLDYEWIKVAGFDYALKPYIKRVVRTFFVNHPGMGWPIAKLFYG